MKIRFHKYQATGNDFILIDNRGLDLALLPGQVFSLCNRRFGIGSDGLILLNNKTGFDFGMRFFNPDGKEASLCGNGGRCITAFACDLGIIRDEAKFIASDGEHISKILSKEKDQMQVALKMKDVPVPGLQEDHFFIHTGSPHFVVFTKDAENIDLVKEARKIRYSEEFATEGTNVDFVEFSGEGIFVRSYERGVEDETLSCGTGVTASALAAAVVKPDNNGSFEVRTRGGNLTVKFKQDPSGFSEIWLEGPATYVFQGETRI
jgi:diaminopimelate epimerase